MPKGLYSGNRKKFLDKLFAQSPELQEENSIILFKGDTQKVVHESDSELFPHQEANFLALFGALEHDLFGFIELKSKKAVLAPTRLDPACKIWMTVPDAAYFKSLYEIDDVVFVDELPKYLEKLQPKCIYLPSGSNITHGRPLDVASFDWLSQYKVNNEKVYPSLVQSRWRKTQEELQVFRHGYAISAEAHQNILQSVKPGTFEHQIEAVFKFEAQSRLGAKFLTAQPVVSSGKNISNLHYSSVDNEIVDGGLVLMDMGAKYHGYCADITTTFPINGKFSSHQRDIYDLVAEAFRLGKDKIKPSTSIHELHNLITEYMFKGLERLGIFKTGKSSKTIEFLLCPHLTVCLSGLSEIEAGYESKTAQELKANNKGASSYAYMWPKLESQTVVTLAPGLYFDERLIQQTLQDPETRDAVDESKLNEYITKVGGVRIERQLVVTDNGVEELGSMPLTAEDIEACMKGEAWNTSK